MRRPAYQCSLSSFLGILAAVMGTASFSVLCYLVALEYLEVGGLDSIGAVWRLIIGTPLTAGYIVIDSVLWFFRWAGVCLHLYWATDDYIPLGTVDTYILTAILLTCTTLALSQFTRKTPSPVVSQ